MSRPGPAHSSPSISPSLPERAAGMPSRPVGSLDRIEVAVHYTAWDVYRMEMAERWRRSYSADAPVLSSTLPFAVVFFLLVLTADDVLSSSPWRNAIPGIAFWFLVVLAAWWTVTPFLEARRHAEA